jgi:glycosyltransferase involved in cell wall biosynthesis
MNKKILFLANHRKDRSPSQRFRYEQYLDYFKENGYDCDLVPLLNEQDDKLFYSKGNWIQKLILVIRCFIKRLKDVKSANNYDIVFIQREVFFTGTTYFEKKLSNLPVKVIFDFDDSIWLPNVSLGNKKLEWLKNYDKTKTLIGLADVVIAGNQYLANYASQFNKNAHIIPTTIDTSYHKNKKEKKLDHRICIGWTGTATTIKHFEIAIPVLIKLKEKYKDRVYFKVIGESQYTNKDLNIKGIQWNLNTEIEDLTELDIGIMPLPNDQWTKGKCGFKGLQYMALEIPTIMSPVGVNKEIIEDGVNGFLANTDDEWMTKISKLIESEALRQQIGAKGRETIIETYSVEANKEKYLNKIQDI